MHQNPPGSAGAAYSAPRPPSCIKGSGKGEGREEEGGRMREEGRGRGKKERG